jgi:signal peptidase I
MTESGNVADAGPSLDEIAEALRGARELGDLELPLDDSGVGRVSGRLAKVGRQSRTEASSRRNLVALVLATVPALLVSTASVWASTPKHIEVIQIPGIGPAIRLAGDPSVPGCTVFRRGSSVSLTIGGARVGVCGEWVKQGWFSRGWSTTSSYRGSRAVVCIFIGANGAGIFEVDDHGGGTVAAKQTCAWFADSDGYVESTPTEAAKRAHRPLPLLGFIPSASMEPTLHCARPASGCEAQKADLVVDAIVSASDLRRGDIVAFVKPSRAQARCGGNSRHAVAKRLIGLPGETVSERRGVISINGRPLSEPYIAVSGRDSRPDQTWHVPQGEFFVLGDNRQVSCDSRDWGFVPAASVIGRVQAILRFGSTAFANSESQKVNSPRLHLIVPKWWVVHRRTAQGGGVQAWDAPTKDLNVVADLEPDTAKVLAQREVRYDKAHNSRAIDIKSRRIRMADGAVAWTVSYFTPYGSDRRGAFQEQYFVARGGETIWLTFSTPTSLLARYQPWFKRIAGSAYPSGSASGSTTPTPPSTSKTGGPVTWVDPIGDAHGAPDIRTVAATGDVDHGMFTFTIVFAKPPKGNREFAAISIDADRSLRTGNVSGFDYWIAFIDGQTVMEGTRGGKQQEVSAPSLHAHLDGTRLVMTISRRDIGGAKSLRFYAWTQSGNTYGDDAPDGTKTLVYTLRR